jgi:hypothetical protein
MLLQVWVRISDYAMRSLIAVFVPDALLTLTRSSRSPHPHLINTYEEEQGEQSTSKLL